MLAKKEAGTMDQMAGMGVDPMRHGARSRARGAWHFTRHFLEMCVAMCVGIGVFTPLYFWVAGQFGYSAPYAELPELSALIVAFNMTAPMVAWMRYRGMEWRPIVEMSAAMVVEAAVLIGVAWLGVVAREDIAILEHAWMMPVMIVPMLFRLDLYTGKSCHMTRGA